MTRTLTRQFAAWFFVLAAVFGVAASCDEGGMYQGGSDSEPGWRR